MNCLVPERAIVPRLLTRSWTIISRYPKKILGGKAYGFGHADTSVAESECFVGLVWDDVDAEILA